MSLDFDHANAHSDTVFTVFPNTVFVTVCLHICDKTRQQNQPISCTKSNINYTKDHTYGPTPDSFKKLAKYQEKLMYDPAKCTMLLMTTTPDSTDVNQLPQ